MGVLIFLFFSVVANVAQYIYALKAERKRLGGLKDLSVLVAQVKRENLKLQTELSVERMKVEEFTQRLW